MSRFRMSLALLVTCIVAHPGVAQLAPTGAHYAGRPSDTGYGGTDFVFRIKYTDGDDDEPAVARVWVDTDGNGVFEQYERFDMAEASAFPVYFFGEIFTRTVNILYSAGSSNLKYYFEFRDRVDFPAAGGITAISPAGAINAPVVEQFPGNSSPQPGDL